MANYFLAQSGGSDSNPGTEGQPFATIGKLLTTLTAGDTGYCRHGSHGQINSVTTAVPSGTSWSSVITIRSYPGETATFTRISMVGTTQYVSFELLNLNPAGAFDTAALIESNNHHIRIANCELQNSVQAALFVRSTTGFCEILSNYIHNAAQRGMTLRAPSCLIEGNVIRDCASNGLDMFIAGGTSYNNNSILRNYLYSNGTGTGDIGMQIANGSGALVANNIIAAGTGIGLRLGENSLNTEVYNNTIYGNAGGAGLSILATSDGGSIARNNIIYLNASGIVDSRGDLTQSHNLLTDPTFVDAANGNFALQSTSAARNAGTTIALVTTDFIGTARGLGGAYDIGAFEFVELDIPLHPDPLVLSFLVLAPDIFSTGVEVPGGAFGPFIRRRRRT